MYNKNNNTMKHLLLFLAALLPMMANADDSGTCGTNLTWTYVEATHTLTISGEGSMANYSSNTMPWYPYRKEMTKVIIENGVTSIGDYAFYGCSGLTSITIPNSVAYIGFWALFGTTWYDNQPDGLVYAGKVAYHYKGTMPDNTSIKIEEGTLSISATAFLNRSGLTAITIPNSVTNIGSRAFAGTAWYNNQPDGLVYAGKVVYAYKGTKPDISNIVLEEGTLGIGDMAFLNFSNLTSITIPNSVCCIGNYAFSNCSGLTSITIPNSLTSIGHSAFSGCSSLTDITIPNKVTSIGEYAFKGCNSLASVTIPNSVSSIGSHAFEECSSLTAITIPNRMKSIGENTFSNCSSLDAITIPNSVTIIGYSAFSGCSGLTSITIPNNVTKIEGRAFYGCSGLTSVTIPNSVTSIGEYAFYGCSGLTSITIPNTVTTIGNRAFDGCSGLNSVTLNCKDIDTWFKGNTSIKEIVIGDRATSICYSAFSGCSGLTSITIGNSVTSIGREAFYGCSSLTSIKIADLAAWCSVDFGDCYSNPLYYVHRLFINDKEITDLIIPFNVEKIGSWAFGNCSSLNSAMIPNSVTSIGNYAFEGCDNLITVHSEITEPFNCKNAFSENTLRKGTLYVPAGTKDLYTRFDGWREFLKIEEVRGASEESVWLTLKDSQGASKLKLKKGVEQELAITPEEGWKLLTVTMDGTDVTAQVKNGNSFTTPAIIQDAVITIVYEQEVPSEVAGARQSKANVKVVDDGVIISNAEPYTRCVVYQSNGQQVTSIIADGDSRKITLQKGLVYILTIGDRTLKFAL